MQLPAASGQTPDTTAYNALNVSSMSPGGSYTDPVTGVTVYKLTNASTPFTNTGMGNDYSDGGQRMSHRWFANGRWNWTISAFAAFESSRLWLVDFSFENGFENWREMTGTMEPDLDLCFSFSNVPETPRIGYVINNGIIRRVDTTTPSVANTGHFPHSGGAGLWLQVDRNDKWFVGQHTTPGTAFAWNSQDNTRYERSFTGMDEVRLERDGEYVMAEDGATQCQRWTLADNTVGSVQDDVNFWTAHFATLRGAIWTTSDPNSSSPHPIDRYTLSGGAFVRTAGIYASASWSLVHHSGNWLQSVNDLTQWAFLSPYDHTASGLVRNAVGVYRANGTAIRLVCHHYGTSTVYFRLPWGTPSPDGRFVLFNSNMNGQSRHDLFMAVMPTA